MTRELLVAGGGIGGLAAAVAAQRAGWETRVFEQAPAFSEAGAGLQLGPNVTRILREWGLLDGELGRVAFTPRQLCVRDAVDGSTLGTLALGDFARRHGAPYLTVHRADLHNALLEAVRAAGARMHADRKVLSVATDGGVVRAPTSCGLEVEGDALVAADGLWSALRAVVAGDAAPRRTGHLAYRALVRQSDLPAALRSPDVIVWLAPRVHVVSYPVRGGEWTNTVCFVEGEPRGDAREWDQAAVAADLQAAAGPLWPAARDWLHAAPSWRLWVLHDRPPVAGPDALAQGRVALLGDAAHPMRPYLAQGAAMAIEDARALQAALSAADARLVDAPLALRRYALSRWQRVARVQRRSQRNGVIFHASGPLRWGRNVAMRTLGERLLDQPWLYR